MVRAILYPVTDEKTIVRVIINGEEAYVSSPLTTGEVFGILNFLRIIGDVEVETYS